MNKDGKAYWPEAKVLSNLFFRGVSTPTRKPDHQGKTALMLCYYFPPFAKVGALRSSKFVNYLGRFGWRCEVVTAFGGVAEEYVQRPDIRIHRTLRIDAYEVLSLFVSFAHRCLNFICSIPSMPRGYIELDKGSLLSVHFERRGGLGVARHILNWLKLPDGQILWIPLALPQALLLARKCHVIYSSSFPVSAHLLGLIIKKLTGKPWVADYRDEWSLNLRAKQPASSLHRWAGQKLDAACVRNADIVINTTDVRTQKFVDHFGGPVEKFITIANGYDEPDVAKFRCNRVSPDKLVITSLGSFYGGRDPSAFCRSIGRAINLKIISAKQIRVNLIGVDNADAKFIQELEELGLTDVVRIKSRVSQPKAFEELSRSHVALLIGSQMETRAMTTKVYEYAAIDKPILALVPRGPVYEFVKKCDGWMSEPHEEDKILQILRTIIALFKQGILQNHKSPRFIRKYERAALTRQLAEYMDACVK